jgi:hypothetical protein
VRALFGRGGSGRVQPAEFQQQVLELRRRFEQSGPTKAVVDESWRQMRHCYDEVAGGNVRFAGLLFDTSRTSFGLHAQTGQPFFAVTSGLAFATAVAAIEADRTANGLPFPEQLLPGVQSMADMCVALAHRAGVPLAGCVIAEALTTIRLEDRTHARELSAVLGGPDARRRLRAVRDLQRRQIARARTAGPDTADTVVALRAQADGMLAQDLDAALADGSGRYVLAGGTVVPAALAASMTGRTVVMLAPGVEEGAAFRLNPVDGDRAERDLCESIALPELTLESVRDQARRVPEVLGSDERRKTVRDRAVTGAQSSAAASVWEPLLAAWPDLRGSRVALVPLGASALLPLFTAPVDGAPVCTTLDLTLVPSGKALLFAAALPRPSHETVLVAADPWYEDGQGGKHIPCTVDEARAVAAAHGVTPLILREVPGDGPGTGQVRGGEHRGAASPPGSEDSGSDDRLRTLGTPPSTGPAPHQDAPDGLIGRIAGADLVHLAAHGRPDPQDPLRTALLLGQPVSLATLLPEDLRRGSTVVLSACHLAAIGTEQSSEQLGFPAAMLAMGAGSVIGALWPVPDSAEIVRLMTWLHTELRVPGTTASAALGRAVAQAVGAGLHPTVWGPFTHVGA